jgi:predicted RecA/RadA family phage recombinase
MVYSDASALESKFVADGNMLDHTPSSAATGGEVLDIGGGIGAPAKSDIAASALGAVGIRGIYKFGKGAIAFSQWDRVYWDISSDTAVNEANAGDDALPLGLCATAAASGASYVDVLLYGPQDKADAIRPIVSEIDCSTDGDTDDHVLIPADANVAGLVFLYGFGVVTEVFAGGTEDQGIVTIEDEDNNALATLTVSDAGADAIGDVITGTNPLIGSATGTAIKTVAAGKAVHYVVTQQTSGTSEAGKMKVYIMAIPLA